MFLLKGDERERNPCKNKSSKGNRGNTAKSVRIPFACDILVCERFHTLTEDNDLT